MLQRVRDNKAGQGDRCRYGGGGSRGSSGQQAFALALT
jgi:hypothetical protein